MEDLIEEIEGGFYLVGKVKLIIRYNIIIWKIKQSMRREMIEREKIMKLMKFNEVLVWFTSLCQVFLSPKTTCKVIC